tara:strand:+ start:1311 stop:2000 length:690 start_codon:yes stop_codon:yes gene_type:complete
MKIAIVVFPGSNCDRDISSAIKKISGYKPDYLWHKDKNFSNYDLIFLPGGFSYGDYLRCGAIGSNSPIMYEIKKRSLRGTKIIGICNGFQILTESKLLPGSLLQNINLKFICKKTFLKVKNNNTFFSKKYKLNEIIDVPIAHMEGRYYCSNKILKELENNEQIIFQYCNDNGDVNNINNPNGSIMNIAGIINSKGNVLGMMPHPERCSEENLGSENGIKFFRSIFESIN